MKQPITEAPKLLSQRIRKYYYITLGTAKNPNHHSIVLIKGIHFSIASDPDDMRGMESTIISCDKKYNNIHKSEALNR